MEGGPVNMSATVLAVVVAGLVAASVALSRIGILRRRARWSEIAPVLLLCLAAAGPRVPGGEGRSYLVVDLSWSVGTTSPDLSGLAAAGGLDPERARVLLFGEGQVWLDRASQAVVTADAARRVGRGASDLGGALALLAETAGPGDVAVVATDGRIDPVAARTGAEAVAAKGCRLRLLPTGRTLGGDVAVRGLRVPGRLRRGEPFTVVVTVAGPPGVEVPILVSVDGGRRAEERVRIPDGGGAAYAFDLPGLEEGFHEVEARVVPPPGDPAPEDDLLSGGVVAGGGRTALLVGGGAPEEALRGAGWRVERGDGDRPVDADLVVLADVAATALAGGGTGIRDFVRDGGGLLVLGGRSSFGPGGYAGRPLESVLPLRSAPDGDGFRTVVLMDRSGTMGEPFTDGGAPKLAVARDAGLRLIRALPDSARFLVVPFTDRILGVPREFDLSTPEGRSGAAAAVQAVGPGHGKTALRGPLERALESARGGTGRTLVLLLTDGRSPEDPGEIAGLADALRAAGGRLFPLAVGADANLELLDRLAEPGARAERLLEDGQVAEAFLEGLRVFEGEGRVAEGRAEVVPGPAADRPSIAPPPVVHGFVRTWAAAGASVWYETGDGWPLVAGGRYGFGSAVAVATDPGGAWAPGWDAPDVLSPLAEWAARPSELAGPRVVAARRGDRVRLQVRLPLAAAAVPAVVECGGVRTELLLAAVGEGEFEGEVRVGGGGAGRVTAGDGARRWSGGFAVPWATEFSGSGPDPGGLDGLRALFGDRPSPGPAGRDAGFLVALLALLVFLGDRFLLLGRFRFSR